MPTLPNHPLVTYPKNTSTSMHTELDRIRTLGRGASACPHDGRPCQALQHRLERQSASVPSQRQSELLHGRGRTARRFTAVFLSGGSGSDLPGATGMSAPSPRREASCAGVSAPLSLSLERYSAFCLQELGMRAGVSAPLTSSACQSTPVAVVACVDVATAARPPARLAMACRRPRPPPR